MATDKGNIENLLLVIRCVGLTPSSKTITQNSGLLSNLYKSATGARNNAKNEKRTIKLSQSEPFKPSGRPPNFNFDLIYTSETLEDMSDITPSLLAEVNSPADMDVKLRLNVYYSSSLTNGKDILLAGTTFSKRELFRAQLSMNVLVSDMTSEHCSASKAYIETVKPLSPVLHEKSFQIISHRQEKLNPLNQKYVFYNEFDSLTPFMDAEEFTWEPKFAAKVPLLFLENFTASLIRSTYSWNLRYELERMRQGRFHSMEEALRYGWHSVTITVHAARIGTSKAFKERVKSVQQQLLVAQQAAQSSGNQSAANINLPIYTVYTPTSSSRNEGGDGSHSPIRDSEGVATDRSMSGAATGVHITSTNKSFVSQWNTKKYDETAPSTFVEISIEDSSQVFQTPIGRTNTEYYTMEPIFGSNLHATHGRKASLAAQAASDTVQLMTSARDFDFNLYELTDRDYLYAPQDITKKHRTSSMDRPDERASSASVTNVTNPITSQRDGGASTPTAAGSGQNSRSTSQESARSRTVSTSNAIYSQTNAPQMAPHLSPTPQNSVTSAYQWVGCVKPEPDNVITVLGKETHFYKYVSQCDEKYQTAVKFDFCLEDSSGNGRRIGQCHLPLRAGERTDAWLPVKLLPPHPSASDESLLYEDVELHVVVNVKSPEIYNDSSSSAAAGGCDGKRSPFNSQSGPGTPTRITATDPSTSTVDQSTIKFETKEKDPFSSEKFTKAPAAMPDMYLYQRNIAGVPQTLSMMKAAATGTADNSTTNTPATEATVSGLSNSNVYSDYRGTISDCYEWMWHLGFNGIDPLVADESLLKQQQQSRPSVTPSLAVKSNIPFGGRADDDRNDRLISDDSLISSDGSLTPPGSQSGGAGTGGGGDKRGVTFGSLTRGIFNAGKTSASASGNAQKQDDSVSAQVPDADRHPEEPEYDSDGCYAALDDISEFNNIRSSIFETAGTSAYRFDPEDYNQAAAELGVGVTSKAYAATVNDDDDDDNDGDVDEDDLCRDSEYHGLTSPGAYFPEGGVSPVKPLSRKMATVDSDDEVERTSNSRLSASQVLSAMSVPVPVESAVEAVEESFAAPVDTATTTVTDKKEAIQPEDSHPIAETAPSEPAALPDIASLSVNTKPVDSAAGAPPAVAAPTSPSSAASSPQYIKHSRVDYSYDLHWMRSHIEEMEKLSFELRSILPDIRRKVKADTGFRSSALKKQVDVQPLPINLHYQILGVRPHSKQDQRTEVIHSITCGSMSPHKLGHKKGGLFYQESQLVAKREELDKLKRRYLQRMIQEGGVNLKPQNNAAQLLSTLGTSITAFEESCLSIGYRRVFAISQSLSIAVNALLLKLNLGIEGQIPGVVVEKWLSDGFLIVFEGLLSVISHERSMLEDTISAVEALRSFQVRLLPLQDTTVKNTTERRRASNSGLAPTDSNATSAGVAVEADGKADTEGNNPDASSDSSSSSSSSSKGNTTSPSSSTSSGTSSDAIDIDIQGREVLIYIPREAMDKLPPVYQIRMKQGGAILTFVPVLFTQGIDIQQTMATTFGDKQKGKMKSADLQHYVNVKALSELNAYSYRAQPAVICGTNKLSATITDQLSQPHPLVQVLYQIIHSSSITMKNIDMLIEVERVCLMLGGCRVTFCKSGKDRTGMAVTLEQSRQLGERFGCGVSQTRTLRDANLMRLHGVRILIAEKNIGRKIYSINKLQVQFLPILYRPPMQVCEDMMKKDNS